MMACNMQLDLQKAGGLSILPSWDQMNAQRALDRKAGSKTDNARLREIIEMRY